MNEVQTIWRCGNLQSQSQRHMHSFDKPQFPRDVCRKIKANFVDSQGDNGWLKIINSLVPGREKKSTGLSTPALDLSATSWIPAKFTSCGGSFSVGLEPWRALARSAWPSAFASPAWSVGGRRPMILALQKLFTAGGPQHHFHTLIVITNRRPVANQQHRITDPDPFASPHEPVLLIHPAASIGSRAHRRGGAVDCDEELCFPLLLPLSLQRTSD